MTNLRNCRLCRELERGYLKYKEEKVEATRLYQTENFAVFPTIGQLVEGYLLISPKNTICR